MESSGTRLQLISLVGIVFIILGVKWETFSTPPFWDSLGFYVPMAYNAFKNGLAITNEYFPLVSYHTPLPSYIIALLGKIFGWGIPVVRLFSIFCTILISTGVFIFLKDKTSLPIQILASLAVFFTPVILSESGMAHADIPMAAFFLWSFIFYFKKKYFLTAFFLTLTIMSNGTAIVLFPLFLVFSWRDNHKKIDGELLKKSLFLFGPAALCLLTWLAYYYQIEGSQVTGYGDPEGLDSAYKRGWAFVVKRFFFHRPVQIFLWDGRFCLSLLGLYFLARKWRQIGEWERPLQFSVLVLATEWIFLSFVGTMHNRYFIIAIPFLVIGLVLLSENKYHKLLCIGFVASSVLGIAFWLGPPNKYAALEYRKAYQEQGQLLQKAAAFLEANDLYKNQVILSHWPLTHALQWPFLGLVNSPYQVLDGEVLDQKGHLNLSYQSAQVLMVLSDRRAKPGYFLTVQKYIEKNQLAFGNFQRCQEELSPLFKLTICLK